MRIEAWETLLSPQSQYLVSIPLPKDPKWTEAPSTRIRTINCTDENLNGSTLGPAELNLANFERQVCNFGT